MASMIDNLLGRVRDPMVSQGLLALGGSMMQAGAQGQPTGAAFGQGLQAYQQAAQGYQDRAYQLQEREREQNLRELREKAISQITDEDLQLLAALDPSGQTVAQVMAAQLRARTGVDSPSSVREWEYYNSLTPAQQQQYLAMKRAAQFQDLGGYVAPIDPRTGAINPGAATPKTLPPQDLPSVRGAQAAATEAGRGAGEATYQLSALESQMPQLEQTVSHLGELGKTSTYTTAGKIRDVGRRELGIGASEGAKSRAEYIATVRNVLLPQLRAIFGAQFTALEGERLEKTLGDPDTTPEEKEATLRAFIEQKRMTIDSLRRQTGAPAAPATGGKTIARTGRTRDGRRVVEYTDGTREVQ